MRREYLTDQLHENVSFTPERGHYVHETSVADKWGLRVEYLFTTKDAELKTGSWMHFHSGVTTEAAITRVVVLLEAAS